MSPDIEHVVEVELKPLNDSACEDHCPAYTSMTFIFYMVSYFGSACSIVSGLCNLLIFVALASDKKRRSTTYFLYLIVLASFDIILCVLYIPVIVIDLAKDKYAVPKIAQLWRFYFAPLNGIANLAMTAACYMIVIMQLERFLMTVKSKCGCKFVQLHRRALCIGAVLAAAVLKGPIAVELTIVEELRYPPCPQHPSWPENRTFEVIPSSFSTTDVYIIYKFWVRNIFTVILPFLLLAYFNFQIVTTLSRAQRHAQLFRFGRTEHKQQVRAATRTFLLIVSTYLVSNAMNVVITVWEFLAIDMLFTPRYCALYMSSTDFVSVLSVLGSALRLPIYLFSNVELRETICPMFMRFIAALCPCIATYKEINDEKAGERNKLTMNGLKKLSKKNKNDPNLNVSNIECSKNATPFDSMAIFVATSAFQCKSSVLLVHKPARAASIDQMIQTRDIDKDLLHDNNIHQKYSTPDRMKTVNEDGENSIIQTSTGMNLQCDI